MAEYRNELDRLLDASQARTEQAAKQEDQARSTARKISDPEGHARAEREKADRIAQLREWGFTWNDPDEQPESDEPAEPTLDDRLEALHRRLDGILDD